MQKIILIGNYPRDEQESMQRFAQMLDTGFYKVGIYAEIWQPIVLFGLFSKNTERGLNKWLGYIDKYLIYPLVLTVKSRKKRYRDHDTHFHICDHSNAIYLPNLPKSKTSITCHDVLAIMGARGVTETYVPATFFGKILQRRILRGLNRAELLAAVSANTLVQLKETITSKNKSNNRDWRVIYNAFNADFKVREYTDTAGIITKSGLNSKMPFILHVGSDNMRKNRKLLIDMVAVMGSNWQGYIYFAGRPVDKDLESHAKSRGVFDRVVSIVNPDHATLEALYTTCEAFIFPSFSEGFGWPLIEAQACGAPVIASRIDPMPEVTGGAALFADPYQPDEFAAAFYSLKDPSIKQKLINQGFNNTKRFDTSKMIADYLTLYGWQPYLNS